MSRRIALNILLFISILFFPWWVSLFVAIVLVALYPAYEVILWGFFFDSLYGTSLPFMYTMQYVATLLLFVLLLLSFLIKRKIIFYRHT